MKDGVQIAKELTTEPGGLNQGTSYERGGERECGARSDDRDRRTTDSCLRADDAHRQIGQADL
jgi:hypothetical protein